MIEEKLTILLENEIIDEETFKEMNDVLTYMKKNDVIDDEDEADIFITHLAMASGRVKNQEEPIAAVDDAVKGQIIEAPEYEDAVQLWDELSRIVSVNFPAIENDYFYLHLVTLLQSQN